MLDNNYYSVRQLIDSKCDLRSKIAAIDLVILNLESALIAGVGQNNDLSEYQFDDGQMKIRVSYRNTSDIADDILKMDQLKQKYLARLNGRRMGLRGGNIYY